MHVCECVCELRSADGLQQVINTDYTILPWPLPLNLFILKTCCKTDEVRTVQLYTVIDGENSWYT